MFFEDFLLQVVTMKYLGLYQQTLGFLVPFGGVFLQIVTIKYLDLYQQTLGFLVPFGGVLLQVLFHRLSYSSPHQQTLATLVLF